MLRASCIARDSSTRIRIRIDLCPPLKHFLVMKRKKIYRNIDSPLHKRYLRQIFPARPLLLEKGISANLASPETKTLDHVRLIWPICKEDSWLIWKFQSKSIYLQCIRSLIKERNNGNSSPTCKQEGVSLPILDDSVIATRQDDKYYVKITTKN